MGAPMSWKTRRWTGVGSARVGNNGSACAVLQVVAGQGGQVFEQPLVAVWTDISLVDTV